MTVKISAVIPALFLIASCASAQATAQQTRSMEHRAEAAAAHVRNTYDETGPGVAYLISEKGIALVSGAKGYANLEWDIAMTQDTAIRIGSLSKPVTAIMILQLAEEGRVDLDLPVKAYAPDLPAQYGGVTLRQYLSHRSGISDFLSDPALVDHIWLPISTDKLIDLAKDKPIAFTPGAKYEYVNFNYVIVAHVIEKVTGQYYADAVNSFFNSHDMANSHFDAHRDLIDNRAAPYAIKDGETLNVPGLDMSHVSAAGALLSSVEDLNRWITLLGNGDLVNKENLDSAWTPQPLPDGAPTSYGLGFNISELCGVRAIWHTGLAPGGQAAFVFVPEKGLFTVALSNAYNTPNTGKLSREMMAAMLTGDVNAPCASD